MSNPVRARQYGKHATMKVPKYGVRYGYIYEGDFYFICESGRDRVFALEFCEEMKNE